MQYVRKDQELGSAKTHGQMLVSQRTGSPTTAEQRPSDGPGIRFLVQMSTGDTEAFNNRVCQLSMYMQISNCTCMEVRLYEHHEVQ